MEHFKINSVLFETGINMSKLLLSFILISICLTQPNLQVDERIAIDTAVIRFEYNYKQFLDSVKIAYQNYVIKKSHINLTYQSVFSYKPMMINRYSALESHTVPRDFLLGEDAVSGVYRRNFVGVNLLAIVPLALHFAGIELPSFGGYVDPFTLELVEEAAWQEQMKREIAKREF